MMGSMNLHGRVLILVSVILLSSCSWIQRQSYLPKMPKMPEMPKVPDYVNPLNWFSQDQKQKTEKKDKAEEKTGDQARTKEEVKADGQAGEKREENLRKKALEEAPKRGVISSLIKIQPSAAQQAAARKMLKEYYAKNGGKPPIPYDEALIHNDEAQDDSPAPSTRRSPTNFGDPGPFMPRSAPALSPQDGSTSALTPPEPDAATRRGIRSPKLPKVLPMDINGKMHTPHH